MSSNEDPIVIYINDGVVSAKIIKDQVGYSWRKDIFRQDKPYKKSATTKKLKKLGVSVCEGCGNLKPSDQFCCA